MRTRESRVVKEKKFLQFVLLLLRFHIFFSSFFSPDFLHPLFPPSKRGKVRKNERTCCKNWFCFHVYISSHSTKEKNPATTKLEMKRKTTIDRGKVFPHFSRALFTVFRVFFACFVNAFDISTCLDSCWPHGTMMMRIATMKTTMISAKILNHFCIYLSQRLLKIHRLTHSWIVHYKLNVTILNDAPSSSSLSFRQKWENFAHSWWFYSSSSSDFVAHWRNVSILFSARLVNNQKKIFIKINDPEGSAATVRSLMKNVRDIFSASVLCLVHISSLVARENLCE